jgi:hypothetical protein
VLFIDDGSSRDGAITDADIELNGVDFAISVNGQTSAPGSCHVELQNNLTHELGHLFGLEHTCLAASDPPRIDDQGNPVPSCSNLLPPKIVDATMYNFQDCGETKKETLSADDIQALCDIYPIARDPGTCNRVGADDPILADVGADSPGPSSGHAGCAASAGARPDASLIVAGATLALLMRRRRPARV